MLNEIHSWLNTTKDFDKGLDILARIGKDTFVISMLKKHGNTAPNKIILEKKLREHLQLLHGLNPELEVKQDFVSYDFYQLPENLQKKHVLKSKLYKEAGQLHSKLATAGSDAERAAMAKQIIENMKANQAIFEEIDYFLKYGVEAEIVSLVKEDVNEIAPSDLVQKRNNLRTYISSYTKKLNAASKEKRPAIEQKLNFYKSQLNEIEERLK
jgi:hypothetical protein